MDDTEYEERPSGLLTRRNALRGAMVVMGAGAFGTAAAVPAFAATHTVEHFNHRLSEASYITVRFANGSTRRLYKGQRASGVTAVYVPYRRRVLEWKKYFTGYRHVADLGGYGPAWRSVTGPVGGTVITHDGRTHTSHRLGVWNPLN